jgi:hypothetical protein
MNGGRVEKFGEFQPLNEEVQPLHQHASISIPK